MAARSPRARAPVRSHRRRHRDDLLEQPRQHSVTLQFDLSRDIDGAARDVEPPSTPRAATCPRSPSNPLPQGQPGRLAHHDHPLTRTSTARPDVRLGLHRACAEAFPVQRVPGLVGGSSLPSCAGTQSARAQQIRHRSSSPHHASAQTPTCQRATSPTPAIPTHPGQRPALQAVDYAPLIVAYHNGSPVASATSAGLRLGGRYSQRRFANGKPSCAHRLSPAGATSSRTVDASSVARQLQAEIPAASSSHHVDQTRPSAPITTSAHVIIAVSS